MSLMEIFAKMFQLRKFHQDLFPSATIISLKLSNLI